MTLQQDQRAMLQLLLERGQSYDDIASLLGIEREAARTRARVALTELAGQDPDADVALSDYILGQADPIGRADVARHLQQDDGAHELAVDLSMKLAAIVPEAELPTLPRKAGKRSSPASVPTKSGTAMPDAREAGLRSPRLSRRQAQIGGLLVGALAVVVAVVLMVSGVFDGGDGANGGSESAVADGTTATAAAEGAADELLATVALEPQDGGNGSGEASFGVAGGEQPYLDLVIDGLPPAPTGRSYVLWLLVDGQQGHPLSPVEIPESGSIDQRFPIDGSTLVIAAATREVDVALANNDRLARMIQRAADEGEAVIQFTGQSVLRGQVPLADQIAPDAAQPDAGGSGADSGGADDGAKGGGGNGGGSADNDGTADHGGGGGAS